MGVRGEVAWSHEVMAKEGGEERRVMTKDGGKETERVRGRIDGWKGGRGEARGRENEEAAVVHKKKKKLHAIIDYGARVRLCAYACLCTCVAMCEFENSCSDI